MPSPVSQLPAMVTAIQAAPTLNGFAPVYLGRKFLTKQWSPPQIVIFPVGGPIEGAKHTDVAGLDVDRTIAVRLRGKDFDQLRELEERFFQALYFQSIGGLSSSTTPAPGPYWKGVSEDWITDADSSSQGEEMTVFIKVLDSLDLVPPTLGEVDQVGLVSNTTKLSTSMGTSDTTASVNGVLGFPSSGLIQIDAEMIRYSGVTPTSFTGLIRGQNGTSAASHALNATVSPVQHT